MQFFEWAIDPIYDSALLGDPAPMKSFSVKGGPGRLRFRDALLIRRAEGWLALGVAEEAFLELRKLKGHATAHPEALKVFQRLQQAVTP